jgi:hypothetical protein
VRFSEVSPVDPTFPTMQARLDAYAALPVLTDVIETCHICSGRGSHTCTACNGRGSVWVETIEVSA